MAGNLWWTLFYALHLFNVPQPMPYFWLKLMVGGFSVIPSSALVFTLQYTNRSTWISRHTVAFFCVEPILFNIALWTNSLHGLFPGDAAGSSKFYIAGILLWLHYIYSYLLTAVYVFLLIWHALTSRDVFRIQSILIILATVISIISTIIDILKLMPWPNINLSPLGLSLSGIIIAFAVFRRHLFDLKPIARDIIIKEMIDCLLVIDLENHIVDFNPAAKTILGVQMPSLLGMHVDKVVPFWNRIASHMIKDTDIEDEILLEETVPRYLNLRAKIIHATRGQKIGWLLVIQDITEHKKIEKALRDSEEMYQKLSIVDELTQLHNSRHFYFQLKIEIERSNRYAQPLTLILLDLDNFKAFNDTYGHVEGDKVLQQLGKVLKRCIRETDIAFRYGGEEFTVLLPMTKAGHGLITAERIRTEFKEENFSPVLAQKEVHMTVSMGIAQYKTQEDMKAFVHRVDQLMYQGKKSGKDRVCSDI